MSLVIGARPRKRINLQQEEQRAASSSPITGGNIAAMMEPVPNLVAGLKAMLLQSFITC